MREGDATLQIRCQDAAQIVASRAAPRLGTFDVSSRMPKARALFGAASAVPFWRVRRFGLDLASEELPT